MRGDEKKSEEETEKEKGLRVSHFWLTKLSWKCKSGLLNFGLFFLFWCLTIALSLSIYRGLEVGLGIG